jgi:segregation and condensation protein A
MLVLEPHSNQVHIPAFDGPLELLLYLIRRKGVDIRFVEIAPITDAYLQHVQTLQTLQLDLAGDFLVMAATLCYLKSCELLPNLLIQHLDPEEEDPIQIRERLARQLMAYEQYREAAEYLSQRPRLDLDVFTKPPLEEEQHLKYQTNIDAFGLLQIYRQLLETEEKYVHHVKREPFSLLEMGNWLLDLVENNDVLLKDCFQHFSTKMGKIICFLTVLELTKHHMLEIFQVNFLGPLQISANFTKKPSIEHIFTAPQTS